MSTSSVMNSDLNFNVLKYQRHSDLRSNTLITGILLPLGMSYQRNRGMTFQSKTRLVLTVSTYVVNHQNFLRYLHLERRREMDLIRTEQLMTLQRFPHFWRRPWKYCARSVSSQHDNKFAFEKQQGLYHNKINLSLTAVQNRQLSPYS